MFLATTLSLALALASPQGAEREASQKPMASLFPAGSYAFAQFAGLKRCRAASEDLGLVKLVERIAGQFDANLIPPELEQGLGQADRKLGQMGLDRGQIRSLLQGGIGIGLGRLTIAGKEPAPSLAIAIDIRSAQQEAKTLLRTAGKVLGSMGVEIETRKMMGQTVYAVALPEATLLATRTSQYLIVSNSSGYLRDCLRCMSGQRPSMVKNEMLARGRKHYAGGGELASLFVNVDALAGWICNFVPYEVEEIGEILGVTGLDGIYLAAGTTENGSRDVIRLGIKGPENGLIRSVHGKAVTHRAASMCQDDTLFYSTVRLDLSKAEKSVGRIMAALPGQVSREIRKELHREIGRELKRNGVSPKMLHEIFAALGQELTIAVPMIGTRTLMPQVVAFVDVKQDGVEESFAKLLTNTCGVELKQNQFQGRTLHYTSLMVEGVRLSPAFTVQDGMLIGASDLRALKATLRDKAGKSLSDQAGFQADTSRLAGASMYSTLRLGDNISKLWRIAEPFAEQAQQHGIPIAPEMLPTEEELTAAIGNAVSSLAVGEHGLVVQDDQPLGGGAILAACGRYIDHLLGAKLKAPDKTDGKPRRKIY